MARLTTQFWNPDGASEWTYVNNCVSTDTRRRRSPGNQAATLVYRLLVQDFATVDSMDLPHVIEAFEVLTFFNKKIVVSASGGSDVNSYTLRIGNKDRE